MYIKRLKYFGTVRWENYFAQYPNIRTLEDKEKIKKILTSGKKTIEENEYILTVYGIVNGIGPGYIASIFRAIITFFFGSVKYFWHDIEYGVFGTKEDKRNADNGLLKYSILGIYENFILFSTLNTNILFKFIFVLIYIPIAQIQLLIVLFCWGMVRIFGNSAFSFIKK